MADRPTLLIPQDISAALSQLPKAIIYDSAKDTTTNSSSSSSSKHHRQSSSSSVLSTSSPRGVEYYPPPPPPSPVVGLGASAFPWGAEKSS
ncbi:uncharacterized protein ACHE_80269S [Aspergillus chevalieri]|uniref:Uncharacterized protein n=1 Tax=Aspergillus chevalieri TaxID=182096 RepID=A0A7R7VX19_ASPCH|nr:uncharacterized protein ACHE_80269S [Aspergillus chevalieri]BCR92368.1 hypothetical protein ACHE_80269S [Aspergillus chevalieri]